MKCFASAAVALVFVPALARAQEGWIGVDDARAPPPLHVGPVAAPPAPAPSAPPAPRPVRTEIRSLRLTVGGVVMASIGTAFVVGGSVVYAQGEAELPPCKPAILGCLGRGLSAIGLVAPLSAIVIGATLVAPGVVMIAVGASPVPARRGWEQPFVSLGPGSARLAWSF
jgi:hypothetical protein